MMVHYSFSGGWLVRGPRQVPARFEDEKEGPYWKRVTEQARLEFSIPDAAAIVICPEGE